MNPVPKPRKRAKAKPKGLKRSPMKRYNAKRRGRLFGAACRDDTYTAWMRKRWLCAICAATGETQTSRTEVEHWVARSHGGRDRGDTFPTCARHRELRHGSPQVFAALLRRLHLSGRRLCAWYEAQYGAEFEPCP